MDNSKEMKSAASPGSLTRAKANSATRPAQFAGFAVDDSPHSSDGLLLHGSDGAVKVTAFVGRHVMDDWVDPRQYPSVRKSLFRDQYNALGKHNLPAIERIVMHKYSLGASHNRQYPFIDILLSDIAESGEVLDVSRLT